MDTKKLSSAKLPAESNENENSQELMAEVSQELSNKNTTGLTKRDVLVLVVDDIVDNVVMLSLDLQHQGYRVITASNGEEAVKVASLMKPNIILMDIGMPLLDGLGATAKIRENETLRTTPVVAITAFSTSGFRRAAYDVGFDGYLTKPIDFEQLHELIDRLLPKE